MSGPTESLPLAAAMQRLDALSSHVWMVRTFIKHSEEAEEDDELCEVHRELYDALHALGPAVKANDAAGYVKAMRKKLGKLTKAAELFTEIQPEISSHTNFQMAAVSLNTAVAEIKTILDGLKQ